MTEMCPKETEGSLNGFPLAELEKLEHHKNYDSKRLEPLNIIGTHRSKYRYKILSE